MYKPQVAYLISSTNTITIYFKGQVHNVNPDNVNHKAVLEALNTKVYDNLDALLSPAKLIKQKFESKAAFGSVVVEHGQVLHNGVPIHGTIVDRILDFIGNNYNVTGLVKFLENLLQNPSKKSLDNLYRFLEHNKMPITEDGCFLAYKRITHDYKDMRTNTFDNSVGETVTMPRNAVEDDPNVTCAAGLHVAALNYAYKDEAGLGNGRVVLVKVNPKDVVSVPTDYNNQKMRVCEYTVLEDFKGEVKQEDVVGKEVVSQPVEAAHATTGRSDYDYNDEDDEDSELEEDDDWYDDEDEDEEYDEEERDDDLDAWRFGE